MKPRYNLRTQSSKILVSTTNKVTSPRMLVYIILQIEQQQIFPILAQKNPNFVDLQQ